MLHLIPGPRSFPVLYLVTSLPNVLKLGKLFMQKLPRDFLKHWKTHLTFFFNNERLEPLYQVWYHKFAFSYRATGWFSCNHDWPLWWWDLALYFVPICDSRFLYKSLTLKSGKLSNLHLSGTLAIDKSRFGDVIFEKATMLSLLVRDHTFMMSTWKNFGKIQKT